MIYIIIGTNTATGNEWVESDTFDNAADAAERCTILRTFFDAKDSTYRVETVEPTEGKSTARSYADQMVAKRELNAQFGKAKMDHEEGYPYGDTDAITPLRSRLHDYTLTELFGWYDGVKAADRLINCHECGAVVSYDNKMMNLHQTWHNKLLP